MTRCQDSQDSQDARIERINFKPPLAGRPAVDLQCKDAYEYELQVWGRAHAYMPLIILVVL